MKKKKIFSAKHHSTNRSRHRKFSRFKLYIEYEGTRYSGWQKQNNARTVQGELFKACREIFSDDFIDLQGSGRTDSGVHALCQVAHLDVQTVLAPEIIKLKLNDILPHDINILEIEKANKNFHARHSTKSRSYIYVISRRRTAFGKNFVWWIKDKLDFDAMTKASELFLGMHDFVSFSDDDPDEKSTKVLVDKIQIKEEGDLILIRIIGSHFIWKMVRRIAGILVEVGRGKKTKEDILYYLNNKTNEPAKYTAPPSGLFLERVYYDNDAAINDFNSLIRIDKFSR
ncbi:MAG: tRNA pseudouridine(38-40) synthase TruA [Ignavibacterium sp.]|nr:tRNA pseudouridine(38-40) synthase TruA [Ignavibacterium sp.]